jgi:RNA polymerase sigma factor (sigma-70 family)
MAEFYSDKKYKAFSDAELLAQYKADDDLQWMGALFGRYMHLCYGVGLKYFADKDKAKDAMMDVFEVVIEKCKSHEVQNFKSWLYVLVKNFCLMQLRKEKGIDAKSQSYFMDFKVEAHLNDNEDKESTYDQLQKCMEGLNTEQKRSVELFYFKKMHYKSISEQTGYDLLKVKSYIQNAKRNLKICIENSVKQAELK